MKKNPRLSDNGQTLELAFGGGGSIALIIVLLVAGFVTYKVMTQKNSDPSPEITKMQVRAQIDEAAKSADHQRDQERLAAGHERFLETMTILVTAGGIFTVGLVIIGFAFTVFRDFGINHIPQNRLPSQKEIYLVMPGQNRRQLFQGLPAQIHTEPAQNVIVRVIDQENRE